jgi:membrane protein
MDDPRDSVGASAGHPAPAVRRAPGGRPASWVIILSAALVAFGVFGRQRPGSVVAGGGPAPGEAGRAGQTRIAAPIPGPGWKKALLRVFYGISEDRILLIAGGVTFYAILALFPGIAAVVSVYGLFADPNAIAAHLDALSGVAPGGAVDVLRDQLTHLAHQDRAALGFGFAVSLVFSLWTANAGVSGLFEALTVVYEEKETRSLITYYALTLAFTAGTVVLVLLSLAMMVALPIVVDHIAHPGMLPVLLKISRWPILFVLIVLALSVIYRFGPSRSAPQWRWITWGSAVAAFGWLAASGLFSWYVANFGHYNKTYGSLGAIIGFMTWMWVSIIVVLVGAKLDAELERRSIPADAPAISRSKSAVALGPARV